MWKPRKEEEQGSTAAAPAGSSTGERTMNSPRVAQPDQARIGKGVQVNGEISGAEDLFIDGEVQGSVALRDQVLTIGPTGKVRASISAGQVVVYGTVNGDITAKRVELKNSANVVGDISTERIVMEDGAYLKGGVDVHKQTGTQDAREGSSKAAASEATPMSEPALAHAGMAEKKA